MWKDSIANSTSPVLYLYFLEVHHTTVPKINLFILVKVSLNKSPPSRLQFWITHLGSFKPAGLNCWLVCRLIFLLICDFNFLEFTNFDFVQEDYSIFLAIENHKFCLRILWGAVFIKRIVSRSYFQQSNTGSVVRYSFKNLLSAHKKICSVLILFKAWNASRINFFNHSKMELLSDKTEL